MTPEKDLVVIWPLKDGTCADCGEPLELLVMAEGKPHCLSCVDLDHLVYLPAGDAALTRRAKKGSGLHAVVVRFSRNRKRYEKQGILVEAAALAVAEEQCLGDEEARRRRRDRDRERRAEADLDLQARMAEQIVLIFPGCPPERAQAIARHTGERGSGRVGRSAAGRALDDEALRRAVVASVRHEDTEYDALLMAGVPWADARERIREAVDDVLARWSEGARGVL